MFEDKQKIDFPEVQVATITAFGQTVRVKKSLSLVEQGVLAGVYMEDFFSTSPSRVLEAEYKLMLAIVDNCTDVEVNDDDNIINGLLDNYDDVEKILKEIKNYSKFRALLRQTVEAKAEEIRLDATLGRNLALIYAKLQVFIEDLLDADVSDERIAQIKKMGEAIEGSPIGDAINLFKNRTELKPKEE